MTILATKAGKITKWLIFGAQDVMISVYLQFVG